MKPALTVEEWAQPQVTRTSSNGERVLVIERAKGEPVEEAGGLNHAVAAIALHGKSFGFTEADGHRIRTLAYALRSMNAEESKALTDLAERIEALLAPAEVAA